MRFGKHTEAFFNCDLCCKKSSVHGRSVISIEFFLWLTKGITKDLDRFTDSLVGKSVCDDCYERLSDRSQLQQVLFESKIGIL